MAKILIVHPGPDFSVADVYRGWEKALKKQGHEVMSYNTNDRLTFYGRALLESADHKPCSHGRPAVRQAIEDPQAIAHMAMRGIYEASYLFWPDIVFFISAFFSTAPLFQVLRKRGHKIVMLHTEVPYQDQEQMMRGQFADLNLLNDACSLDAWKELEVPAYYIPHAYDPEIHYTNYVNKEIDFAFIGTMFKSRLEFFSKMNLEGIDTVFGGNGWDTIGEEYSELAKYLGHHPQDCVDNKETARIYRMSKVGINFYRQEGEGENIKGWAMGPREVEMAACGLFFLRDHRGESDDVFGGNKALAIPDVLPAFSSPEEASDLLRYWVKNDKLRQRQAQAARERISDRTFDNHAVKVAQWMEEAGIL